MNQSVNGLENNRILPVKLLQAIGITVTGLIFLGAIVAGTAILHIRASANDVKLPNPPISVSPAKVRIVDGYTVNQLFAGRIEAARETRLAFERNGLVIKVLANEGDYVEAGAVVALLDISQFKTRLDQLIAQKNELTAQLNLAKATLARRSSLKEKGWSPTQSYDEARYSVDQLTASLERVAASIKSAEIDLNKSELRTPFSGRIAAREIDEGAVVSAGTPVLTILESKESQIRVGVSVGAADELRTGEIYTFVVGGKSVKAKLVSKRPDLQTGTWTVTALFEIIEKNGFSMGEIAELVLDRKVSVSGAWLPLTALDEGRKGLWTVFTIINKGENKIVHREAVEILHASEGRVFVRGTFKDGDVVIRHGINRVIPGQRVALVD